MRILILKYYNILYKILRERDGREISEIDLLKYNNFEEFITYSYMVYSYYKFKTTVFTL